MRKRLERKSYQAFWRGFPLVAVLLIEGVAFGLLLEEPPLLLCVTHLMPSLHLNDDHGMAESASRLRDNLIAQREGYLDLGLHSDPVRH